MPTVLVAVAGALGAVLRYRIGLAVGVRTFPWATLGVNISGSFLLALVLTGPAVARWPTVTSTAVAVGFLGAYTTFSTFGYETFTLLRGADRRGRGLRGPVAHRRTRRNRPRLPRRSRRDLTRRSNG